jgi:cytosine/adenosine deaminase-related metal-dependent hydrolase
VKLKARWVIPGDGPPLADGVVTIQAGRIREVSTTGTATANRNLAKRATAFTSNVSGRTIDLGNVALISGLVNAHAHLEFSDLEQPLGVPGMALPDWIRHVMRYRREARVPRDVSIAMGLDQSAQHGTTCLGEIATGAWPYGLADASEMTLTLFQEAIGLAPDRMAESRAAVESHLLRATRTDRPSAWLAGISPHAPYTVAGPLFAALVEMAQARQAPLAMHLAESREELELLAQGTGPFATLLRDLGVWRDDVFRPGTRPLDYLRAMTTLDRGLVIHGNYLAEDEIALLGRHADHLAVVYCPRTHAYFDHARYPLPRMLEAGVTVALGTDGRGSNPDLNLLAEARHVAHNFPEVDPHVVLLMATLGGARALGLADQTGSITPGKWADLAAVALPDRCEIDPVEQMLHSDLRVTAVWSRGRQIAGPSYS